MIWLCITPERMEKTTWIMQALGIGWDGPCQVVIGAPPNDGQSFAVWGQRWLAERILPAAHAARRPYWHIDNGYWAPAKGDRFGFYRVTYRGMSPIFLVDAPDRAIEPAPILMPWREQGRHILLALPGPFFGRAIGIDMRTWFAETAATVERVSSRPLIIRHKDTPRPLSDDLRGAWAVVTHSSNVAVDAVLAGIPVFVAPSSPAAPVGNLDLGRLNDPSMPDREAWLRSLIAQQFTLQEMASGMAYPLMMAVRDQVDGTRQ